MSNDYNKVILEGHFAADAHGGFTTGVKPTAYAYITLMTNRSYKTVVNGKDEWKEVATAHSLKFYGRLAEVILNTKDGKPRTGEHVRIEGRLDEWNDKVMGKNGQPLLYQGEPIWTHRSVVVVDSIEWLSPVGKRNPVATRESVTESEVVEEAPADIPLSNN